MKPLDWLVVGYGVTGATLAALLADAGFSVGVLDGVSQLPEAGAGWDLRTWSLTPASRRILTASSAWPLLPQARLADYDRMQVWEAAHGAEIDFDAASVGRQVLGTILEQSALLRATHSALHARPRVTVQAGFVTNLAPLPASCEVTLSSGLQLRARAVAACDGADSTLRELVGLPCASTAYPQRAVVANVRTARPHDRTARQVFLPAGPLAFLPLPPAQECSIVWSTTPTHADALEAMDDAAFCAELTRAFDSRLGPVLETSRRLSFPLRRQLADEWSAGRVVLVGDAAHQMHPLAGQGLNVGLLDAAVLAERAAEAGSAALEAPGTLFRRYERQRRGETLAMLEVTDRLNRLFLDPAPWMGWLRSAGLALTHRLGPVKDLLMQHAMGDLGDLPRIARPAADAEYLKD